MCRSERVCGRRQSEGGSCTGAADRMVLELQAEAGCCPLANSSEQAFEAHSHLWTTGSEEALLKRRDGEQGKRAEGTQGKELPSLLKWPTDGRDSQERLARGGGSCVPTEIHPEKLRTASWDCSTGRGVMRIMTYLPINSITAHFLHFFFNTISQ